MIDHAYLWHGHATSLRRMLACCNVLHALDFLDLVILGFLDYLDARSNEWFPGVGRGGKELEAGYYCIDWSWKLQVLLAAGIQESACVLRVFA